MTRIFWLAASPLHPALPGRSWSVVWFPSGPKHRFAKTFPSEATSSSLLLITGQGLPRGRP